MIDLTLEVAERAAKAALAKARSLGTVMTASVVDESGRLVVTMRGDGAGFLTIETSRAKAVAAAAFRKETRDLGDMLTKGSAFWQSMPSVVRGEALPSIGGVPLMRAGRVIGGIGCGGGTGEQDHECAVAGAQAVAAG
jgi:uncharacterized protein GlcG (DUF336 family)